MCGLVIKLEWLTSWSVQHQTQRKGKVRSAEGENRKVAREGEAGQPPSAQQPLVLAQPPCREARGHVASPDWDSHTSSHWPRLQVMLPELGRGFCCSLALAMAAGHECWGYHSSTSTLQTMGKASSGDGFTTGGLFHIPAVGWASPDGACWKCGWIRASAAGKRQGSKGYWMPLLEAVDAMAGPCQVWVPTNIPGSITLLLLVGEGGLTSPVHLPMSSVFTFIKE